MRNDGDAGECRRRRKDGGLQFCNEPLSILISRAGTPPRSLRNTSPLSEQRDGAKERASERAVEKSEEDWRSEWQGRAAWNSFATYKRAKRSSLSLSLSLTADLAHATFSSFRSDDYDGRIHRSSEVFTRTVTASTAAMSIKRDLPFTDKNDVGLSEKEEWQSTSDPRRFFDLRR